MIGLDTNILVRYLTQDDRRLSPKANALIEQQLTRENPGFVSVVVMAETVWVLRGCYSLSETELGDAIERLLSSEALVVEYEEHVFGAMRLMLTRGAEFADALVGLLAARAGCTHTLTFDRRASRLPGFAPLA